VFSMLPPVAQMQSSIHAMSSSRRFQWISFQRKLENH
jgi:hypothetical protein